jgi:hypothetical protein
MSLIIAFAVHKTIGLRVSEEAEIAGIDQAEHAETAYDWGGLTGSLHRAAVSLAFATAPEIESIQAIDSGSSRAPSSEPESSGSVETTEKVEA